jgi:hypothetical protein
MRSRPVVRPSARLAILIALVMQVPVAGALRAQQPPPRSRPVVIRVTTDSTEVQVIRLRDGSSIVGRVTEASADSVRFVTAVGPLSIPREYVVGLREVERSSVRSGEVWPANPHATRLLFAPTGRMLAKGEGYFNDTYLFFLSVQGGVTSRFTLGGGLSVIPFDDFSDNVLFVTPKVGLVASPRFNLAVGGLAGVIGGLADDGENASLGVLYAVGTVGSPDASLTFGTGLAYAGGEFADTPVAMLGADVRLGRRMSFITENYLLPSDDVNSVISYGLRFFGEKLSVDLAFWNMPGEDAVFPGIPYVAFSVNF